MFRTCVWFKVDEDKFRGSSCLAVNDIRRNDDLIEILNVFHNLCVCVYVHALYICVCVCVVTRHI